MRTAKTILFTIMMLATAWSCALATGFEFIAASDMEPCEIHGTKVLLKAMESRGILSDATTVPQRRQVIKLVDLWKHKEAQEPFLAAGMKIPEQAESFLLLVDGDTVHAGGTGPVGTMYAAYQLAEIIEMADEPMNFMADIKPGAHVPSMEIRAVNPFFHVESFQDPESWYYDEKYWETYLDELSLDRYNLLDIHAMYGLYTTFFPNCYLYMLHSDKFPDVGIPEAEAAKNLEMFKKIVKMAKDRGIRTSLMSYHASWRLDRNEEAPEPPDKELADYTAEMVTKMIDSVPDLWMVGFRIGESSRPESFFQDSYIRGVEDAGRDINLFTRSWVANPFHVRGIADAYPGRFYIEIKYNGEQLGLPYNAMTSNRKGSAPSYTWEDYTNWPRNYKILWQIRSNGTHRLFRWGDPVFAERSMRSVQFGDAAGFTMEPMTSYYPPTDYFHKNPADYDYFTWDHQRNWLWYMLWGRLSYDPDTPESVWVHRFAKRFGKDAAQPVYDTVVWMSRIVPMIYSYRCMGPDHRNMAPEYETGGTLVDFSNNIPLDFFSIRAIDEYVRWALFDAEMLGAKLGPFGAADLLDEYADQANAAAQKARASLDPKNNSEFKDILNELECLTHLAHYYSNKIRAATHYRFFLETGALDDLTLARSYTVDAHDAWEALSTAGETHYTKLLDTLRIRRFVNSDTFTWRDLQPSLAEDIVQMVMTEADLIADTERPTITHRPKYRAPQGQPLTVNAALLAMDGEMKLFYRPAGSEGDFTVVDMQPAGPRYVYTSEIPASAATGEVEYYIAAQGGDNKARYPSGKARKRMKQEFDIEDYLYNEAKTITNDLKRISKMEKKRYVTVDFRPESDPPEISIEKVEVRDAGATAHFEVRVKDQSDIGAVELFYKPLPTQYPWENIKMEPAGGGLFTMDLKLDEQGLMYYVNAADVHHNAAAYPDFLEATPYEWINSWDAKKNPYAR